MSLAVTAVATTAIGAGASIYGARKASKASNQQVPKPVDIFAIGKSGKTLAEEQAAGYLDYLKTQVPGFISLSDKLGPRLMNQMFRQSGSFLDKQSALERRAGFQAVKNIADLRGSELKTMRSQTPLTRGLMDALSPEQSRAIDLQQRAMERAQGLESEFQAASKPYSGMFGTMAEEAFSRRGTLSPEEQRATEQRARESATAAGRVGGNAAIAAEIQNREAAQAARRQEASGAAGLASANLFQTEAQRAALRGEAERVGQNLYGMAGQFYTTPGLNLLSNVPNAYKVGTVGAASAISGGPAASGSFDFNMPLNFANQMAGAQNQANQANYQTNLANQQAKAQMWSSIGSSMMGMGMNMGGGGSYGSMLGGGLSSIGGQTGNTGLYNYGANLYNQNLGYGTAPKALIV